ncbi:MAG: 23S rRNA (uracil(1939)-C(5))-methyltransferase RlmD [Lachnospiraceae bacterium]|nr:23S rRNA (uracil(1939)-C(5))-methyltransferase RlmD [Lachnospiraceae bacterium]
MHKENSDTDTRNRSKKKSGSRCPVSHRCGGCQWIDMPYEQQLIKKQKRLKELLSPFGRIDPILGMEKPEHYRNKVHGAFGLDQKKQPIAGIYEEKSHRIISVEHCYLENEQGTAIIQTVRNLLRSFKIKVYDEDTGYGLLRHVLVRVGKRTGEIMVVLVLASPILPSKNNFVKALCSRHPEITTVVINVNDRRTSMVLGNRDIVVYGKGYIEDVLCGKRFKISPRSFYQINSVQTELLYERAVAYAGLTGKETVLDAYCGIGTIGLVAADRAKQVIGVELNKEAVRDAISNAAINKVGNIAFYQQDAGEFLGQLAEQKISPDVIFMDPPRAGSCEAFLNAAAACGSPRIVYISCNPETLARDLQFLVKKKYRVERMQGVDMFPFTEHVETVCLLSKLNAKQHIEIDLRMDELDLTDAEKKATYQQIQEYLLTQKGLKVSTLCIAQVKQKCGIIERESYRKSASENAKQPQCTKEKEEAIMEAFRHFGMI